MRIPSLIRGSAEWLSPHVGGRDSPSFRMLQRLLLQSAQIRHNGIGTEPISHCTKDVWTSWPTKSELATSGSRRLLSNTPSHTTPRGMVTKVTHQLSQALLSFLAQGRGLFAIDPCGDTVSLDWHMHSPV